MIDFSEKSIVSLIGMAGAGKSTLAPLVAERLGWECVDTDHIIQSYYGQSLQEIVDRLGVPEFRIVEEKILSSFGARRTVVSTGGSVVYGPDAMERLKALGPVVFLKISQETCLSRIGGGDGRGLAMIPGQTVENLYEERQPLYSRYADFTVQTDKYSPEDCAEKIWQWLDTLKG
ncbi:homoserine kinase [Maridesulfovibrio bastinii]|uniref:homoserine kinase n=1 Tax=Maridesulfovibrio bastinii TaxID=47157 RepID=UPI0003F53B59|nr:homoserine kinase [Maridesulfovibrio bastinii]